MSVPAAAQPRALELEHGESDDPLMLFCELAAISSLAA